MDEKCKVVISKEEIADKVKELGQIITNDYKDKNLLVVSLLKGSFIFTADLVRKINLRVRVEFMTTSSYGSQEYSSGKVRVVNDLHANIEDYDILIVDDIVDSGNTMKFIMEYLRKRNPKSVKSCVLLDKPERREVEIEPDYYGFRIPDLFIAGYGLNYGDYYRNVEDIFVFEDK
ncbi:hypoxanthine phosphoribosyltransferase [Senegalia massiliensis]|uniref:Hypoxanthine phosphoribosyltransferase n=1 Tax=Senegalia massiliensis TaxID=1720316 RepID=A0A845QW88_9CLOT|nr:hypoxanthine phosphoribosyltransferase [Senegalia massiliensis]NBI05432.1 hypoxanthine phosphoribosyltransferase [Senegalia massiliensis]